jgi:co-chaperonin GroES (HSP10)
MILKGKRILIEKPVRPESGVILTDEAKASIEAEMFKQYSQLVVTAVGDEVTSIKAGDKVYIGSALANCEIVDIDGAVFFIAYESNVAIIWDEQEK